MNLYYKAYNVAAGYLEYKFWYDETLSGIFDDFTIVEMGDLKQGFDDADPVNLSIYPANVGITINDYNGDNYSKFEALRKRYNTDYPFNFDDVFKLEILLNGEQQFDGVLDELRSVHSNPKDNNPKLELGLEFIDGINKLKEISLDNPYVLNRLFNRGIIPRIGTIQPSYAYGFESISPIIDPNYTGYYIGKVAGGDRDTNLKNTIVELFRLLKPSINVDFQNEFEFSDLATIGTSATIEAVKIRRILSNFIGRYVVLNKTINDPDPIIVLHPNPLFRYDYNNPNNFEIVFEDDLWRVFKHTWSGNPNENRALKFEKGIDEKQLNEVLKVLAKNLFSYYGFIDAQNVFFRHRRFRSDPEELTGILHMEKMLTIDKKTGVKIDDYFTGNNASEGKVYGNNVSLINHKIPLNAFQTDNGFEYRLTYQSGGDEYRVLYFKDLQTGYKNYPMNVIAKAEYEAFGEFLNQYKIELSGVDKLFYKSYLVNRDNYHGIMRPLVIGRNFFANKTTMIGLELENLNG